jgi:hypothetical protein
MFALGHRRTFRGAGSTSANTRKPTSALSRARVAASILLYPQMRMYCIQLQSTNVIKNHARQWPPTSALGFAVHNVPKIN